MHYKIGFCCKYIPKYFDSEKETLDWLANNMKTYMAYNVRTSTLSAMSKLSSEDRKQFLLMLSLTNLYATLTTLEQVSKLPKQLRMMRLSSDLLPFGVKFDKDYKDIWSEIRPVLAAIGNFARKHNIRLSFHPAQFVLLASLNENAVNNSIMELDFHAYVAESMGYSGWHDQGFAINIHGGAKKAGLDLLLKNYKRLSKSAQNFLTIENDEFSWCLKDLEKIAHKIALVMDTHHYWIHNQEYIAPDDPLVDMAVESWRGVRPKLHLALSAKRLIDTHLRDKPLEFDRIKQNKRDLRAHSFAPWHAPTLDYIAQFTDRFDIMWEGKNKNLGAKQIYEYLNS